MEDHDEILTMAFRHFLLNIVMILQDMWRGTGRASFRHRS